ncbi:MAG: HEAT repeat domain-containing protein [Planctomycetes bacterium]|nr:HEAT repeat domain-containing protein [Planctomycetota bacterium]
MVLSVLASVIFWGTPETAFDLMQVPDGFSKQLIATEPEIMDPVAFCFDDDGNILVAESFRQEQGVEDNRSSSFWLDWDLRLQSVESRLRMYERFADQRQNGMAYYSEFEDRIRKLEDQDGDGVFETATIFADGFNDPLDGTGAGVLAIGDSVYYTCIPHVWKIEDGKRESLFGAGFGVRTALRGHDMHGLALGLDGRMYWSIGDRGYHIELDNGKELHSPGEGAVFRSELDGANLEVFHHGLRNPQELAFDNYGNLFTGDNNSDAIDKARLVYCVEGGETGWRMEYQTLEGANERGPWVTENGWDPHNKDRPAWILPAIDVIGSGPSGLVAYPGGGFAERYNDHFFMCDFRGGAEHSSVLSFALEPDGAHFNMVDLHPFVEKVLCTDVDFGYNGKMVISDWGEGWTGNEEGRLYSVWDESHVADGDVSEIFASGFTSLPVDTLIQMLSHVDRRVRIRAQYELADRKNTLALAKALQSDNQLVRIHAMWALAMIDRSGERCMEFVAPLLDDLDPEIRVQACKILGEAHFTKAFAKIVALIDDPNSRVSYFATMALGYLGNAKDAIIAMLERNNNEDVYLRHAGVVALTKTQYAAAMANLQTHPSQAVRLAAVLVLRRMESEFVADYLNDPDDDVATEAARAIHDGRIDGRGYGDEEGARQTLAASLSHARTIPWQKRAISANKMEHDCYGSVRVAEFAADATKPYEMRLLAMQALNNWGPPSPSKADRDIVEGRVIPRKHMSFICIEGVDDAIHALFTSAEGELLMETLRFVSSSSGLFPKELCDKFVLDEKMPVSIRAYALQVNDNKDLIEYALQSEHWKLRSVARDVLLSQNDLSAEKLLLEAIQVGEIFEAQEAIKTLTRRPLVFSKIDNETLRDELQLDFAEPWNKEIEDAWLLHGGNGIIGKQIVFENSKSECLRCHKIEGEGGIAGPPLDDVANRLDEDQLLAALLYPNENVAEGFGDYSAMPPMGVLLSKREIRDVIEYLKTLQK